MADGADGFDAQRGRILAAADQDALDEAILDAAKEVKRRRTRNHFEAAAKAAVERGRKHPAMSALHCTEGVLEEFVPDGMNWDVFRRQLEDAFFELYRATYDDVNDHVGLLVASPDALRKALQELGREVKDLPAKRAALECKGCNRPFRRQDPWPGAAIDETPLHLGYACILRGTTLQGTPEPNGDAYNAWWEREQEARRLLQAALGASDRH